jgi:NAD(P)-dependent dehydrogenase (short-subunit alcohol dehydrogenase family)
VAVVTGGNGGIGFGIATGLAQAGADVAIWARNVDKSALAIAKLMAAAPERRFISVSCDVSDHEQVADAMVKTVQQLGRVDSCVANAGIPGSKPFLELTPDEWYQVVRVNLDGTFFTLQTAARQMVDQGEGGALVAVSSTSAIHGAPLNAHYAATKTGILGLARSAAVALARYGIRVNSLLPGWTLTDLAIGGYQNEKFRDATIARTPVRRWAQPEDFAAIAVTLCDKSQIFHTGDSIVVDGGYTVF